MASSTSILADRLHEYPQQDVIDGGTTSLLDACLNEHDGVLSLVHRYAGRTFCTPVSYTHLTLPTNREV